MAAEPNRYAAFISYRHMPRDRLWAMRVMRDLETYRTAKALQAQAYPDRIAHLFRDEDEIPACSDLSEQIKDALKKSDNLIVVCSPDTPASRWVRREIELFQEMGKGDRVIPLLIAGEPEESYPPELRRRRIERRGEDGTVEVEEIEPIAADVRPRKDERKQRTERRALLRLAATLLGCRFDDLARRDEERRRATLRNRIGTLAAAMIAAASAGLWWWDANLRVHTHYCANYAERWGAPECVGELGSDGWRGSNATFRLRAQGGRVLDMARVNGSGEPTEREQTPNEKESWSEAVAQWRFAYRSGAGNLASVTMMSKSGRLVRQISYDFSEDRREAVAKFDRSLGVAERQTSTGSDLASGAWTDQRNVQRASIGQHRLAFHAEGRLILACSNLLAAARASPMRWAPMAATAPMAPRASWRSFSISTPEGRLSSTSVESRRESRATTKTDASRCVEWVDSADSLAANGQGYARIAIHYDERGNETDEAYFGVDGKPALGKDGEVARITMRYDERGNVIEQAYFGVDGRPALHKDTGAAHHCALRRARQSD